MGNGAQPTDIELQLSHLVAENESLKAQLEEYLYIISTREQRIETLQRKIGESTESLSNAANQEEELYLLQDFIDQLKQQARGSSDREMDLEKQLGHTVSAQYRYEDLGQQYTHLQAQLTELQDQVQELSNRNLMLQQQASRIAELESQLENALRERDELKEKLSPEE